MTSEMIVRDCVVGVIAVGTMVLLLTLLGVPAAALNMAGGVAIGLYLFGMWVSLRYE